MPGGAPTTQSKPTGPAGGNGAGPAGADVRERLRQLLERLTPYVDLPAEDGEMPPELIRGAHDGLLRPGTESDLLLRHAGSYDGNSLLVISLGCSLRRYESELRESSALPAEVAARLRSADDPAGEAGEIAEELAGPRRHKRLIAARLAGQVAAADPESGMPIAGAPDPPDDAPHSASDDFLAIFAPGSDVWQQIETWARATGRHVARERNRALLDAAGVGEAYDVEPLVDRLDVDFLFRLGYVLATCEEELSRADS